MNTFLNRVVLAAVLTVPLICHSQVTADLPGRSIIKLLPDYSRPRIYALNKGNGTAPGTLLALNPTNGAAVSEISVGVSPTDMAMTPKGEAIYVINGGSRTILKVDLAGFNVSAEKTITTPETYNASNPLYVVAGRSNLVYFTDGAWGPNIYIFDFAGGTNTGSYNDGYGAGGMVISRDGATMFKWMQYGWSAGYANSWITRLNASSGTTLSAYENGPSQSRDPLNTPILLDASEQKVFNKLQMVSATNVSVLLCQYTENIYAISFDGTLAFGPTKVFNAQNGIVLTNFSLSTTVQALSGDQKRLFRWDAGSNRMYVHAMSAVAPVNGPELAPTPADGIVLGQPPSQLAWSVSPIAIAYDVYFGPNKSEVQVATLGSAQYQGRVSTPFKALGQALTSGVPYFWRVDVVGFSTTNTGSCWSFSVSPLGVTPQSVSLGAIKGYSPANTTLRLTSEAAITWTAGVGGASWLSLDATAGTTPAELSVRFETSGLAAGTYTNWIWLNSGGSTVQVPVTLDVTPLDIRKMATDYERPYVYALQAPALSGQNGQLLFINTTTGNIDKTLPIGINPVDLAVHHGEGRLYVASWGENATYVVDLESQSLLPPLHLGTDVYKINAGKPGQIVVEGEDQWITATLIDTGSGAPLATAWLREGDGEMDPTGRYYFHCDNNISSAGMSKFDVSSNSFVTVTGVGGHYYYGSRNVIMSADGKRLFWTGGAFDDALNELGNLGQEIYATTAHGDLAFSNQKVINVNNGQAIYNLPFSTTIIAVSGDQQRVFLFNSTTKELRSIPMSDIASVPAAGLNPTPSDGAIVNLPLSQVSWTPSPFALSYRVFFGTSSNAVSTADTNSPLYLGATTRTAFLLPAVDAGTKYFWRVDSVGFSATTRGIVWGFTTSTLTVSPSSISLKGVVATSIAPQELSFAAGASLPWTMAIEQPWITASQLSGTTPAQVVLSFNTAGMGAGYYTNFLQITANGTTQRFPVVLQLFSLAATKMAVDPDRDIIYVLHSGSGGINDAFVLFLNTASGVVETVLPIGSNPTDLTVHSKEDRLYVSNWQRGQTRVISLETRTELPPLSLGTDVYKINAGSAGRIVVEGQDQWVYATLVNTTYGTNISSISVREGDGEFDPTGRYYYHVDNNSSGATIQKYDTATDGFALLKSAGPHSYYGSRNLVRSLDGSRLFWTGAAYDANLVDLGVFGAEIYAASTDGSIAFADRMAYQTSTRGFIGMLPASSTVMAVDRKDERLWYFNPANSKLESFPMATVRRPTISADPAPATSVSIDGSFYLTVTAIGYGPLTYQWLLGGAPVPAETNSFLSVVGAQPAQAGDYRVVVSGPYSSVTSAVARVVVLVPPAIVSQPEGKSVLAGQSFELSVGAVGTAPLSYAWIFENTSLPGEVAANLTVQNAQPVHEGAYRVRVSNSAGVVTSAVAMVRVIPSAPQILTAPVSLIVGASSNATFSVIAMGTQPLRYQWTLNGMAIPGATNATLSIINVQAHNGGTYQVQVVNGIGTAAAASADLTVLPIKPWFAVQPVGKTAAAGSGSYSLTALARGSEPIGYQWLRDGTNVPGAFGSALSFTNVAVSDSGSYVVAASNLSGWSTSAVAALVITAAPPVFTLQPSGGSVLAGTRFTLTCRVSGATPIAYQWFFDSALLPGQTNSQLTIDPVALNSAGQYFVVASNLFAATTSAVVSMTVTTAPPVFTKQPSSGSVIAGGSYTFTSFASGATPAYQWFFNGAMIPGQTGQQLTLTSVRGSNAGTYFAIATNVFGRATSQVAQLTVYLPPYFVTAITNMVVDQGATVVVAAEASGSGSLRYSWALNGVPLVNTNQSLILTNVQLGQSGYYSVTVGGQYGSTASTSRVSVLGPKSRVSAWGDNSAGQTNVPLGLQDVVSVAGGDFHSIALQRDGATVSWGAGSDGQLQAPAPGPRLVRIAAGGYHNAGIREDGSVVAWGRNDFGQCNVPATARGALDVAAGEGHTLALLSTGSVIGWGDNTYGQASGFTSTRIQAIAAGRNHSLALRGNGTIAGWGFNAYGQASPPSWITNAAVICAGYLHSAAVLSNGTVVAWGDNTYGQVGVPAGLSNVVGIAAGDFHTLALKADGTVVGWGNDWFGQTAVPAGMTNAWTVACGYYHALGLVPILGELEISPVTSGFVLKWDKPATLQWAPTPQGPFQDVAGATGSTYTNLDFSGAAKFYRLRR